jgi:phospho-N-acetylmuramoyl-pentapeptide-transferase
MTTILITGLVSGVLSAAIGFFLIPMLRALKAGQSIREVGPTWHNNKAGTPMMGGIMFILAAILCLLFHISSMEDFSVFYVLILALCFGLVGFMDDFTKMKFKRNLGLTSLQKMLLQMAVCAVYLYVLYSKGVMTCNVYIPFVGISFDLHPIVYIFFAMFVMVGTVNSVNLTDGVDGLSSSVTIPVMVFFAAAAIAMDRFDLALLPAWLAV